MYILFSACHSSALGYGGIYLIYNQFHVYEVIEEFKNCESHLFSFSQEKKISNGSTGVLRQHEQTGRNSSGVSAMRKGTTSLKIKTAT
jgi:hypothetical protein